MTNRFSLPLKKGDKTQIFVNIKISDALRTYRVVSRNKPTYLTLRSNTLYNYFRYRSVNIDNASEISQDNVDTFTR